MRDTGMVRRIDELGRVVIPKEIRKTLRIKEGDPLEIYTDKDELVFKKFSPLEPYGVMAENVANSIYQITEKPCIITDTDNVICVSGNSKDIVGKSISQDVESLLKERESIIINREDGGKTFPIFKGEDLKTENMVVVPIISNGDCFGSVAIISNEKTKRIKPEEIKVVQLGAMLLSNQFDF